MGSIPQLSIVKGKQSPLYPRLLHKTFEERVDKTFGEKTALIFRDESGEERRTNYNTMNSSANRIASTLLSLIKSRNLQANGDDDWIIAVCMKPSDNLVTTLLSIWKCGGKTRLVFAETMQINFSILGSHDSCILTVRRDFSCEPNQSHRKRIETCSGNYVLHSKRLLSEDQ